MRRYDSVQLQTATVAPEPGGQQRGGRPGTPGAPASGPATLLLAGGAALTAGIAGLVRYGYTFGLADQLVLTPKGVSLADPGAFQNDWFVHHAPQPHWLFDLVTWAGSALGILPMTYLMWWLLSLAAFGTGAAWLCRRFLGGTAWPALLLGPLLVAGPVGTMGTTGPLLGIALPHVLGACLAFAALAAVVNGYWRAAVTVSLLAGLVHVQHGANLAVVLLAAGFLGRDLTRRVRLTLATAAGALVVGAALVGRLRRIDPGGDEWLEICQRVVPFHCDANSWSLSYHIPGMLVVAAALGLFVAGRRHWRSLGPAIALPAVGALVAVLADWLDVPVLGHLVQRSNAYRLASMVMPFAAFGLLALASAARHRNRHRPLVVGALFVSLAIWFTGQEGPFGKEGADRPLFVALAMTMLVAAGLLYVGRAAPGRSPTAVTLAALALLCAVLAATGQLGPRALGYNRDDPLVAAALAVRASVPEGSVIAAPPSLYSLGPVSQRAVIADCKRIPYGGTLWDEYKQRMAALGGRECRSAVGFGQLRPADLLDLRTEFGATHVLLPGDDPKISFARQHWQVVAEIAPAQPPGLSQGWWLFELPEV